MSDPARTILDNLKEQFAAYKKQTAILVSLSIVLIVVVFSRFVQDSPRSSAAAEPEAPAAEAPAAAEATEEAQPEASAAEQEADTQTGDEEQTEENADATTSPPGEDSAEGEEEEPTTS